MANAGKSSAGNRALTSNSPRINWKPNAFLVEMVKNRKPGRALDVGMGQGRNALWLAGQGWDTTGGPLIPPNAPSPWPRTPPPRPALS